MKIEDGKDVRKNMISANFFFAFFQPTIITYYRPIKFAIFAVKVSYSNEISEKRNRKKIEINYSQKGDFSVVVQKMKKKKKKKENNKLFVFDPVYINLFIDQPMNRLDLSRPNEQIDTK